MGSPSETTNPPEEKNDMRPSRDFATTDSRSRALLGADRFLIIVLAFCCVGSVVVPSSGGAQDEAQPRAEAQVGAEGEGGVEDAAPEAETPVAPTAVEPTMEESAEANGEAHWPQFRGHQAKGVVLGADLPTTWNVETGENIAWKTPIPGLGHSSPVVWGNRIFVTTAVTEKEASLEVGLYGRIDPVTDEGEVEWRVLALDREKGEILWNVLSHRGQPAVKRHTKASHASSTPAVDGERVVAMFGSEGLYAYDHDGELLWKRDLGVLDSGFFAVPEAQWGFASSPVLHDGRVYLQVDVQGDSYLTALDASTGETLWRTPREEVPTWGSPTLVPRPGQGLQVVVNGWKHIGGYDAGTGAELWRFEGGGDIPVPTPVLAGDLLLITNAHGEMRPIYAVRLDASGDLGKGEELDETSIAWWLDKAGNYMQTPIVVGGIAYFCLDNGALSAYTVTRGEQLYKQRLGRGTTGFTASPVGNREHLYFTSEDGDVFVIRTGPELVEVAKNELGETFMSSPAIAGDHLLFRARRHLFAIGGADGG